MFEELWVVFSPGSFVGWVVSTVAFLLISYLLNRILLAIFRKISEETRTDFDDVLFERTSGYLLYVLVILSVYFSTSYFYPGWTLNNLTLLDLTFLALAVVGALVLEKVVDTAIWWHGVHMKEKFIDDTVFPFLRNVVRIFIYASVVVIILGKFGIEIGPLLTGLGIAGLAVALALQDTLTNLFSGFYIIAERPFRAGDYVRIGEYEGKVKEVGWRCTKLVTLGNVLVVIPNSKVSQSVVMNFSAPTRDLSVGGTVTVSYDVDPEKVIKLLKKTVEKMKKKDERLDKSASPTVRIKELGDYGIVYEFFIRAKDPYVRKGLLADVYKEFYRALKKAKYEIPYPIHVVRLKKKGR